MATVTAMPVQQQGPEPARSHHPVFDSVFSSRMAALQPHASMHLGGADASMAAAASLAAGGMWKMAEDGSAAGAGAVHDVSVKRDEISGASIQGVAPNVGGQPPLQASTLALLQYQAAWQQLLAVHQVQQAAAASVALPRNNSLSDASKSAEADANFLAAAVQKWQDKHLPVGSITPLQQAFPVMAAEASRGAQQQQQQPVQALAVYQSTNQQPPFAAMDQGGEQLAGKIHMGAKAAPATMAHPSKAASKRSMSVAANAVASTGSNGQLELVFPRRGRKSGEVDCKIHEPVVITIEVMQRLFHLPLAQASQQLGLSPTAIKGVCRRLGIKKWPFRMVTAKSHRRIRKPRDEIIADAMKKTKRKTSGEEEEEGEWGSRGQGHVREGESNGLSLLSAAAEAAHSSPSAESKAANDSLSPAASE